MIQRIRLDFLFFLAIVASQFLFSSCGEKEEPSPSLQQVNFVLEGLEFQLPGNEGARLTAVSFWNHLFANQATLDITNKNTQTVISLAYNPNNFSEALSVNLPPGEYSYQTSIMGGTFETTLPFSASGEFTVSNQSTEVIIAADTDYGLITLKNEFVKSAKVISPGETDTVLSLSPDQQYLFLYVKGGTSLTLSIVESLQETEIRRDLTVRRKRHTNFILQRGNSGINILDLVIGPFEYEEEIIPIG